MTPEPQPLLCLWTTHAPQSARIAAWRSMLPIGSTVLLGASAPCIGAQWLECPGDPLSTLRALAQAYPLSDVVLANLDTQTPDDFWKRLLDVAEAHPEVAVLSAPDNSGGDTVGQRPDAPLLLETASWSPDLSYWRRFALRDAAHVQIGALPTHLPGALLTGLHVQSSQAEASHAEEGHADEGRPGSAQTIDPPRITLPEPTPRSGANLLARARFNVEKSRNALTRAGASLRRRGLRNTIRRALQELRGSGSKRPVALRIPASTPFAPFSVRGKHNPMASIVVPVYNHFEHTLTCLRALAASTDSTGFEVIVVDDASSDETALRMRDIAGVRYHRNVENLGFIGACNAGATLARGDYLVFLNNDTAVQPGWLDALIGTFDAHPRAGLVGAKLVYPDGRLQEAGGIVFRDGSGWNYGRFDDPQAPVYNHVREADYCSGAAIALPRALFERLGGFDALYSPAYYEDTDLAMKVRAEGLQVLYQPAATVVHFEGVTSGTDTSSGIKAYQISNQRKFLARWLDTLAGHPLPNSDIRRASEHRARRRVLVIDASTPMPDRDSGSLRLINLLALLREEGCAVTFFADNLLHDGPYTEALQSLGIQAWWKPWIRDVPAWFAEHGDSFDTIIVSRYFVASNYLALARRHAPQARFVFDTVDLHYLRQQREAEIAGDVAGMRAAQHARERELWLIRESDITLVVSPVEQELLAREAPGAHVELLSNVHRAKALPTGFSSRKDIVFVGGYRHPPNADAALWMAREIFPIIRAHRDDILLHLIGGDVTAEVLALGALPGVRVHGHVPDLDPYMDGCRIGLAPLRYGAGVKGKVNLSMAHGQPVVATPAAVEGMHLHDGIDVLVGADAQGFADAVLRLYDDPTLWQTLARHGIDNIERHFSFDAARKALRRVLG
jgi:GT2 family glycosyltransferase